MAFQIKLDDAALQRALDSLGRRGTQVIARSMNRAVVTARAVLARDISQDLGLRVGVIRDQLKIRNARPEELKATISVSGKPLPLINFKARQTRQGVSANLPTLKRYEGAFIATVGKGQHRGVFKRVPGANRRGPKPNRSQLPIYELHGPSLPKVFAKLTPNALKAGEEALMKNLAHEINYALTVVGS